MAKQNCWEFMKCGREPGGSKAVELGVCPASTEKRTDGANSGKMGGRACWQLVGTLCGGKVQGSAALKMLNCMNCEFYKLVIREERSDYQGSKELIALLKKS